MNSRINLPKKNSQVIVCEGYVCHKDVYAPLRDGVELCVDVFLPLSATQLGIKVPAICSLGPHGKDIHPLEFGQPKTSIYTDMYQNITPLGPHACFELMDPQLWSGEYGYAIVRADSRGIENSQGRLDPLGFERTQQIQADAEGQDLYDLIEWVAVQAWCSGKTAMAGTSYYGMVGYWAAMQKPPHLTAVFSFESSCDIYVGHRKGGVYSAPLLSHWLSNLVLPQQHGRNAGEPEEVLKADRAELLETVAKSEFCSQGPYGVLSRVRKLSDIEIPFYLCGNWSDCELHLPGNVVAFNEISSEHKWLEMHNGNHLGAFYSPDQVVYQKKFFDCFLKEEKENGMFDVPRIRLAIRQGTREFYRVEKAFPPLDAEAFSLSLTPDHQLTQNTPKGPAVPFKYDGLNGRINFQSPPFEDTFEILGTPYMELNVSTNAEDMNIFITLTAIDAQGERVILRGNHDEPMYSFCRACFRLSHRATDFTAVLAQKVPIIRAAEPSRVERGKMYTVLIPLLPTTYVFEKGTSIDLELGATDTAGTLPVMSHTGGDITEVRFGGFNSIWSHGRLVLPSVRRHDYIG